MHKKYSDKHLLEFVFSASVFVKYRYVMRKTKVKVELLYPILSYPLSAVSYPILSYPIVSAILSYPILSYPILSCFAFIRFCVYRVSALSWKPFILSYPILSYPYLRLSGFAFARTIG